MKKLLLLLVAVMPLFLYSQSIGYLRYDTLKIEKVGGSSELVLKNKTRDTTGFLFNTGSGITQFKRIRQINDTTFVAGNDTIKIASAASGGSGLHTLNGLSGGSQTFATGTTGTDFNISSSGSTHSINIPTASASNRGLVTSALFNAWQAKIGPGDTAAMLSGYLKEIDTLSLSDRINTKQVSGNYITGLTGDGSATGPIGGGVANFVLSNTSVVPGDYVNSNITVDSKGRITAISNGTGGGSGTDNTNLGSFYRWLTASSQGIKTVASSNTIAWDSTSNSNALTAKVDTSVIATQSDIAGFQAAGNYITGITGDLVATGPGSVTGTIQNDAVTFPKFQNITSQRLLGRYAGTNGDMQEITLGTGFTLNTSTGVLDFSGASYSFTAPLSETGGVVSIANSSADGTTKGAASFASSDFNAASGNITLDYANGQKATSGQPGFLSATDWTTFNSKLANGLANGHIFVGNGSNIATDVDLSGDADLSNTGALTLNTVNSNVGSFAYANITVNGKGLITAASAGTIDASPTNGSTNPVQSDGVFDALATKQGNITLTTTGSSGPATLVGNTLNIPQYAGGGGGGSGTVNTGTQYQLAYYAANGTTVDGLTLITANRALASNANGLPVASTTTATELGYVSGVTSAIQTQLDGKQASDADLTAIAGLSPTNDDIIQRKSGAWTNRTMTQLTADLIAFSGSSKGLVPASDGDGDKYLSADGTFKVPPGSGGSGSDNAMVGAGFRPLAGGTQNLRTWFGSTQIAIDSTTNTNGLTLTVPDGSMTDAKLATGINANKLADGSVSNDELQRISTVTSNVQTQINGKANSVSLKEKGLDSDADLSFGSSTFGTDDTEEIQAILNTASASNPLFIDWDIKASFTGLKIKSYTYIKVREGCGGILRDGSNNYMWRTDGWTQPFTTIENYNITIDGGIWNGNGWRGGGPGDSMQVRATPTLGVITGFHLVNVRNLTLKNMQVLNTRTFAILGANWENALIENSIIDQGETPYINQDGIDLLGHASNVRYKGLKMRCGDERLIFVANPPQTTYGYTTPYNGADGDQVGITVEDIEFWGAGKGFRFNSTANKIHNVYVRNVWGPSETYYLLVENGDNLAPSFPLEPGNGDFDMMVFENIQVEVPTNYPTDYLPDFTGAIMLSGDIKSIVFKNITRNDLAIDRPTFGFGNPYSVGFTIQDFYLDGYTSIEDASTDAVFSHLSSQHNGTINRVSLNNINIKHSGANGSVLLYSTETLGNVQLHNVLTDDLNQLVYNSGTLATISATNIRHGGGTNDEDFNTNSTVSNIVLSNYISETPDILGGAGTFTTQKGDAFASGGGASDLATVLTAGNKTGNGASIVFENTSVTNGDIRLFNRHITNNIGVATLYPDAGTNVGSFLEVSPKGTGFSSTIKAGLNFYNTDIVADGTNYELVSLRSVGSEGYTLNSMKAGTGTARAIDIQIDNGSALKINTDKSVTLNGAYTLPLSIGSSGQALVVPASGTTLEWATVGGGGGSSQWDDITGGIEYTGATDGVKKAMVRNSSTGGSAISWIGTQNDDDELMLIGKFGSNYAGSGILNASYGYMYSSNALSILSTSAPINFSTDVGATTGLRIAADNEIRAAFLAGSGSRLVLADSEGDLSAASISSTVRAQLSGGTGISYNSTTGVISTSNTNEKVFSTTTTNATPTQMSGVMTFGEGESGFVEVFVTATLSNASGSYMEKRIIPFTANSSTSIVYWTDDQEQPLPAKYTGVNALTGATFTLSNDSNGDLTVIVTGLVGNNIVWTVTVKKYYTVWAS